MPHVPATELVHSSYVAETTAQIIALKADLAAQTARAEALQDELNVERGHHETGKRLVAELREERDKYRRKLLKYIPELEAAEADREALHKALRRHVLGTSYRESNLDRPYRCYCIECDGEWNYGEPERHVKDCLAAPESHAT